MTRNESLKEVRARLDELRLLVNLPGDVPLPVCSACRRAARENVACAVCGRIFHASCLDDGKICRDCARSDFAGERPRSTVSQEMKVITLERDMSELLLIPEGEFGMGEEHDSVRVWLDSFFIGMFCVTNAQYAKFVREAGHRAPNNTLWNKATHTRHPVVNVSWDDAQAYAEWAGCELPTEAQWEKAARGPNGYMYPWGNEWDPSKIHYSINGESVATVSVDEYPQGASGYGTYQQAGNVCEWCYDWYSSGYFKKPEAARNPRGPSTGSLRVYRGGSWTFDDPVSFRASFRNGIAPSHRSARLGFRLAKRA